jgi:hypothetical protein
MFTLSIKTIIITTIALSLLKTVVTKGQRKFKHNKEEIELTKVVKIDQNCPNSEITIFVLLVSITSGEFFDKRHATTDLGFLI